jgi:hypothetical protein
MVSGYLLPLFLARDILLDEGRPGFVFWGDVENKVCDTRMCMLIHSLPTMTLPVSANLAEGNERLTLILFSFGKKVSSPYAFSTNMTIPAKSLWLRFTGRD